MAPFLLRDTRTVRVYSIIVDACELARVVRDGVRG